MHTHASTVSSAAKIGVLSLINHAGVTYSPVSVYLSSTHLCDYMHPLFCPTLANLIVNGKISQSVH